MLASKIINVLFDEGHSESWTISLDYARFINRDDPENSSYSKAATALAAREFCVTRNLTDSLTAAALRNTDLLVIAHPSDNKWERTVSHGGRPKLSGREIKAISSYVERGGALLIISEYENDKYGNNLNDLLRPTGIQINNDTVSDKTMNLGGTPTWVLADLSSSGSADGHLYGVDSACFYRAASCSLTGVARATVRAGKNSSPKEAVLIAVSKVGKGRVAVVGDSDLFGDEYFDNLDHSQLWLNIVYWLTLPAFMDSARKAKADKPQTFEATYLWNDIKEQVNWLRVSQNRDGSLDLNSIDKQEVSRCICALGQLLPKLERYFPHQSVYLEAVEADLRYWRDHNFAKPNFRRSLSAFKPQDGRQHRQRNFSLFPMYTPNASMDTRFESLLTELVWPDWLAEIYANRYAENTKFLSARLVDYTEGYASECAVLFPETVSITGRDENQFGMIFCDREAERYRTTVLRAAEITKMRLHPELNAFLESPQLVLDTYALWDLIHDTSHSRGELPFDPFMVRQKAPYWMYALEELRVDLRSFLEASELSTGFPAAGYVRYAVLFDRIFRFAASGSRIRNYDGLAGQLLFTALHARNIVKWRDNVLSIDWPQLHLGVQELYDELISVYRRGQVVSKVRYWSDAHDFLCGYLASNVATKWSKETRSFEDESDPKALVDSVHDDEFPLGSFHLALRRKLNTSAR